MRLFFSGPALLLIFLSALAALSLLAVLVQRTAPLTRLGERAAVRLDQGRIIPMLWGLAATVFVLLGSAVLFSTKVLALLGVLLLTVGLALASVGLGVFSLWLGLRLADAAGVLEADTLSGLRLGLWSLLLASLLPFAGWLLVLLGLAAGIGAVLEVLVTRQKQ